MRAEPQDFRALIEARAGHAPDAPFLCAPETRTMLSYAALRSKADALAALFERSGAGEGARVAYMLPNGLAAAAAFLGTMASGRIVVPVNLLAQDAHLDHTLAHARRDGRRC